MNRNTWYVISYVIWMIALVVIVISMASFLSSRPAGASHGPAGYVISDCCRGVNPRSGTSYRTVALVFQSTVRPVFESRAEPIEYILQWPRLESTTDQLIRVARQNLKIVMVHQQDLRAAERRYDHVWYSHRSAIGMACLAGGLMLVISFWPYRKTNANK